jgi:hypothetical protein
MNHSGPTKRAQDAGVRCSFSSIFPWTVHQDRLASSFLCSQAESTPSPSPVSCEEHTGLTQTVRRRSKKEIMRRNTILLAVLLATLLIGCMIANVRQPIERTISPDLSTGTALVGSKFTQIAELTAHPMTPLPTEQYSIVTMPWTPSPEDIVVSDNGKSIDIWITSRVALILDSTKYPKANLTEACVPDGVLGKVSNIPIVPANFYVIRYEGVQLGKCIIRNGQFEVTINVVNHP